MKREGIGHRAFFRLYRHNQSGRDDELCGVCYWAMIDQFPAVVQHGNGPLRLLHASAWHLAIGPRGDVVPRVPSRVTLSPF